MNLAPLIDHTLLSPDATAEDIAALCTQARAHGFASVCVLPSRVPQAAALLAASPVKVCTVVGFPHGGLPTRDKVAQIHGAMADGAQEIDAVINIGLVKDANWAAVSAELEQLRRAAAGACLKIIFETGLLTRPEIIALALACTVARVDFVKTSTGTVPGGATIEDVQLLASTVGDRVKIKASGGITTAQQARALVDAGAHRLGTSRAVAIIAGAGKADGAPGYQVEP